MYIRLGFTYLTLDSRPSGLWSRDPENFRLYLLTVSAEFYSCYFIYSLQLFFKTLKYIERKAWQTIICNTTRS